MTMQRIPEPELMDDPEQALAYTRADFSASHGARVQIFQTLYPQLRLNGPALDLGCGSGDVLLRFARAYPGGTFLDSMALGRCSIWRSRQSMPNRRSGSRSPAVRHHSRRRHSERTRGS